MTNEQINALTDAQINVMMQKLVSGYSEYQNTTSTATIFHSSVEDGGVIAINVRNYCNDPAAMMPLVFSEGIGLYPERFGDGDVWVAAKSIYKANNFRHTKPLRAAAIVYLKARGFCDESL